MNRFCLLILLLSQFTELLAAERTNIVLIMADDLSHKNLSCYGATNFETPNLDRLAATGMRFDHCYSMPLCTPSRVMLMTGQHKNAAKVAYEKLKKTLQSHREGVNRALPSGNTAAGDLGNTESEATKDFMAAGLEFVLVERGEFVEGAKDNKTNSIRDSSVPEKFWIGKYEVTQEAYASTMGVNPSTQKSEGHPVESVSWHDATEFSRRLNESLRASGTLPVGHEVRLPTSTEWEWAARGGNKSQDHPFAGASQATDVGWIGGQSSDGHHRVGEKQPNELGVYDMTGNVWEWCSDSLPADRTGKPGEDTRIKRGGSYFNNEKTCFITNIGEMAPSGKGPRFGFRVVIGKPLQQIQSKTSQAVHSSTKQPNILWIVTDDQRSDSIAAFNRIRRNGESGSALGHVLSPNVDRLSFNTRVRFTKMAILC